MKSKLMFLLLWAMPAVAQMADCAAMMAQKEKLQAEAKAQNAQLLSEMAQVQRAPEKQKVSLLAGVVTRMLEQRAALDERQAVQRAGHSARGVLYPVFGWLLSPMMAGVAMSLSSVSVIANALRLRTQRL